MDMSDQRKVEMKQNICRIPYIREQLNLYPGKQKRRPLEHQPERYLRNDPLFAVQDSPLFKLSFEIRQMIWRLIVHGYKLMGPVRLDRQFGSLPHWDHCKMDVLCALRNGIVGGPTGGLESAVSLMSTCRAIYHETVKLLYEVNNFHIEHPWSFVVMTETLPTINLHRIRSLEIHWSFLYWREMGFPLRRSTWLFPNNYAYGWPTWLTMCDAVLSLPHLTHFALLAEVATYVSADGPPLVVPAQAQTWDAARRTVEADAFVETLAPLRSLRLKDPRFREGLDGRWELHLPRIFANMLCMTLRDFEDAVSKAQLYCTVVGAY